MRRLILWTLPLLFAMGTVAFLVALFVFAYQAALTPGKNGVQVDAAFVSFMGALVTGCLTAGAGMLATLAEDEGWS